MSTFLLNFSSHSFVFPSPTVLILTPFPSTFPTWILENKKHLFLILWFTVGGKNAAIILTELSLCFQSVFSFSPLFQGLIKSSGCKRPGVFFEHTSDLGLLGWPEVLGHLYMIISSLLKYITDNCKH